MRERTEKQKKNNGSLGFSSRANNLFLRRLALLENPNNWVLN